MGERRAPERDTDYLPVLTKAPPPPADVLLEPSSAPVGPLRLPRLVGVFGTEDLSVRASELPPDALLVDVREPYEWEAGHVAGSRHVPVDLVAEAAADLPRGRPIVLICLGGARAAMCAAALRTTGLHVLVLENGLRGWVAAGHGLHHPAAYLAPHGRPPATP